jgi:SAM-dependent methyltransferase
MTDQIKNEEGVHGTHWNAVHGRYFSDSHVAAPLVEKIKDLAGKSRVEMIVDLGGGTGFLLSQLLAAGVGTRVSLVNLDYSAPQLGVAMKTGISCIRGSVDSFLRQEVGPQEKRFLFIMRSVLHYFGEKGLRPVLRHLRSQAKPGEYFIHQTASFRRQQDADCLNELYQMMRTQKWYPTVDFLCECLKEEGWQVIEVLPVLPLRLACNDLVERYHIDQNGVLHIIDRLSINSLISDEVFKKTDYGFCAFLHYWIYVCTAADPVSATIKTDRYSTF